MNEQVDQVGRQKVKEVKLSYCKWFCGALVLAGFATYLAFVINSLHFFTLLHIKILRIFSLAMEASALGQLGYSIQTWCGKSDAEMLNYRLFVTLSSIGFLLATFSWQLE